MATCTSRDCNTKAELKGLCKRCYHREYMRIRRQDPDVKKQNAERTRIYLQTKEGKAKRKAYRQRPEVKAKEAEQGKKWRANNKEHVAETSKKWRQENPDRVKELKKAWDKTTQGKKYARERGRIFRLEHPKEARKAVKKYGDTHKEENKLRSIELFGKTAGIIGFGRIGNNVAKYLYSMGMKIIYYDPYVKNSKNMFKKTDLNTLLKSSDVIILSAYLTNQTFNMCDENFFNRMKKKPYFINTSRGELIREKALINALKKQKISGAAVDVIRDEQTKNIINNPLIKYSIKNNNLIITPHIAGLSIDSESKAAIAATEMLKKSLR